MQLWYGKFYMHQYKQSSRWKSVFDTHTLSEDEGSKHIEEIKIKKLKF
jgi:hypothetical protein